jgi:hypothetical protein
MDRRAELRARWSPWWFLTLTNERPGSRIDQLLFRIRRTHRHTGLGRAGMNTAWDFSCWASPCSSWMSRRATGATGQLLALAGGAIALAALAGYLYSVVSLYRFASTHNGDSHGGDARRARHGDSVRSSRSRRDGDGDEQQPGRPDASSPLLPRWAPLVPGWLYLRVRAGLYGAQLGLAVWPASPSSRPWPGQARHSQLSRGPRREWRGRDPRGARLHHHHRCEGESSSIRRPRRCSGTDARRRSDRRWPASSFPALRGWHCRAGALSHHRRRRYRSALEMTAPRADGAEFPWS